MTVTITTDTITGCIKAEGIIPTGGVLYMATNTTPTGYLKCNGAAVSRTTYASLFAVIGTTYGSGNGSTTFNVPDLRGEFVRCFDDARGVDSGRAIASTQSADFAEHQHRTSHPSNAPNVGNATNYGTQPPNPWNGSTPGPIEYDVSYQNFNSPRPKTTPTGGNETRPRNVALLACIKY